MRKNERKKEKDVVIADGELVKNSEKGGKKNLKKTNTQERQRKVSNLCLSK